MGQAFEAPDESVEEPAAFVATMVEKPAVFATAMVEKPAVFVIAMVEKPTVFVTAMVEETAMVFPMLVAEMRKERVVESVMPKMREYALVVSRVGGVMLWAVDMVLRVRGTMPGVMFGVVPGVALGMVFCVVLGAVPSAAQMMCGMVVLQATGLVARERFLGSATP